MTKQSSHNENHLNLVRLLAALGVLFSHSYSLAIGQGGEQFEPLNKVLGITVSYFSVDIFFVISGFLITASAVKFSSRPTQFAVNRIARIFPGLIAANIVTVIAVVLISHYNLLDVASNGPAFANYLFRNSSLILGNQYRIAEIFSNDPYPYAINGSLWTLRWEMLCYIVAFTFVYIAASRAKKIAGPVILGIIAIRLILHIPGHELGYWLESSLRFSTTFGVGVLFYFYREKLSQRAYVLPLLAAAAIFFLLGFVKELSSPLTALVLLNLALSIKGPLLAYNRLGDYSYGTYIYAFPIQQSLMHVYPFSPLLLCVAASTITIVVAMASWHFVELPLSKRIKKYAPEPKESSHTPANHQP